MFLILVTYKKPLEDIERFLPAHISFLDKYYAENKLIFSGRRTPRVGGMILANVETKEEVEAMVQEDPFKANDLADYDIIEFTPTKGNEYFRQFVQ